MTFITIVLLFANDFVSRSRISGAALHCKVQARWMADPIRWKQYLSASSQFSYSVRGNLWFAKIQIERNRYRILQNVSIGVGFQFSGLRSNSVLTRGIQRTVLHKPVSLPLLSVYTSWVIWSFSHFTTKFDIVYGTSHHWTFQTKRS